MESREAAISRTVDDVDTETSHTGNYHTNEE